MSGGLLLFQAEAHGFLAAAEMMAGFAVGADQDARLKFRAEFPAPQFEGAGGDELEIIKMRVDTQNPHAQSSSEIGAIPRNKNCRIRKTIEAGVR